MNEFDPRHGRNGSFNLTHKAKDIKITRAQRPGKPGDKHGLKMSRNNTTDLQALTSRLARDIARCPPRFHSRLRKTD